ncbi:MAG TPA: iron-containing redox enzyme family protein [Arenibaculum sp.]|nr:iron-containing redox enzyme family protein [Arenibaculum sp.]
MFDTQDHAFHLRLNTFYLREMGGPDRFGAVPLDPAEREEIVRMEAAWNAYEEGRLDLGGLPDAPAAFASWYSDLHRAHRREVAEFFDFLAERAPPEALAFYIGLEEQVDGRFDDVIALAQIGMAGDMKLALAENYWDEMGLGKIEEMHTVMFGHSAAHMRGILEGAGLDVARAVPAAALKNGNLLMMYALRRQYSARLLGALAILEHTAPHRFSRTVQGLRRIGMPEDVIRYHDMHIAIDANHGKQLLHRVLLPLVQAAPHTLREVCMGCLVRYRVALDYYDSIRTVLAGCGLADARAA